ncbi:hypothetical protein ACTL6U_21160 [Rhodovibrionaceae bacterium A322]
MADQVLVKVTVFDRLTGGLRYLHGGTADYLDPLDNLESYIGVMTEAPLVVQEIGLAGSPLAAPAPGTVQVTFQNDGPFDRDLTACAFEGWPLEIFAGGRNQPLSRQQKIFTGLVTRHEATETSLTFSASDLLGRLDRELQTVSYLGDGSPTEGSGDLAGQLKPLALGHCLNVPAVAVDRARHLWQLADPGWCPTPLKITIERLWAAGVPILLAGDEPELESQDPPDGQALYDSTRGLVKLATDATDGSGEVEVTADIRVEAASGGSCNPVALARLLAAVAGLSERLDFAAFDGLETATAGLETGLYLSAGGQALAALDDVLAAAGIYRLVTGDGSLTLGQLRAPDLQGPDAAALVLDETEILLGSFRLDPLMVPPDKVKLAYDRNNLLQSDSLAAGADAARLDFLASEYRYHTVTSSNKSAWPEAEDLTLETGLLGTEAAAQQALQRASLFGGPRLDLTLETEVTAGQLRPGQQIWLSHGRFFPTGRAFVVLRLDHRADSNRATLRLLG